MPPAIAGAASLFHIGAGDLAAGGIGATMQIDATTYQSENFNERPDGTTIDAATIHTTEGEWDSDAEWMCNPNSDVSTHYTLAPDGKVYQLVDPMLRAWHAGESYYAGRGDWNDFSIGIEISHRQGEVYTIAQLGALDNLMRVLIARFTIPRELIAKHAWVATPAGRKIDPTDWSDQQFSEWTTSLYQTLPPVDPLRVRSIQGVDRLYYCGVGFYNAYTQKQGLWWLGYPQSDETRSIDLTPRDCTYMRFERATLKYTSQEGVRTALETEADKLGWNV